MKFLHPKSLGLTLDAIAEALFFERKIPAAERTAAAKWIASRQGRPGAYAQMFAPTSRDALGFRLFTGEQVRSRAGIAHLLGEEGCRVLLALETNDRTVHATLRLAVRGMSDRLEDAERRGQGTGIYCCGTCSAGYWRNLAIHLFPRAEERLHRGLTGLKARRRDDGQWQGFPFYYTSLALTEIGPGLARAEMRHAAPRWRNILPQLKRATSPVALRRAAVGDRLLALCE